MENYLKRMKFQTLSCPLIRNAKDEVDIQLLSEEAVFIIINSNFKYDMLMLQSNHYKYYAANSNQGRKQKLCGNERHDLGERMKYNNKILHYN